MVVTAPPPVSSGSILKVVLIVVAVLALCAVLAIAGVVYMVHRTVAKVKQAASDAGVSMSDIQSVGNTEHIDPCKYLSARGCKRWDRRKNHRGEERRQRLPLHSERVGGKLHHGPYLGDDGRAEDTSDSGSDIGRFSGCR